MRAQQCIVLPGERASAFEAFEAALLEELAPQGALQAVLAQRVVAASWRLARAERLEAELFARNMLDGGGLGRALIRDCNGARAFDTLLRYRGGTLAELWRALRTLKALQAEQAAAPRRAKVRGSPPRHPSHRCPPSPVKYRANPRAAETLTARSRAGPRPRACLRRCHAAGRLRARGCQTNPSATQTPAIPPDRTIEPCPSAARRARPDLHRACPSSARGDQPPQHFWPGRRSPSPAAPRPSPGAFHP